MEGDVGDLGVVRGVGHLFVWYFGEILTILLDEVEQNIVLFSVASRSIERLSK